MSLRNQVGKPYSREKYAQYIYIQKTHIQNILTYPNAEAMKDE